MTFFSTVLTVVINSCPLLALADGVDWKLTSNSVAVGYVTLPGEAFSNDVVLSISKRYLNQTSVRHLQLILFSVSGLENPLDRVFLSERTFEGWRDWYDRTSQLKEAAARLVLVGPNSVLEYHGTDGRTVRTVLAGTDPMEYKLNNRSYRILHIGVSRSTTRLKARIRIYARAESGAFAKQDAEEMMRAVATAFAIEEFDLLIRQDAWFVDPSFPGRYLFEPIEKPPSRSEYYSRERASCSYPIGRCWTSKGEQ